MKAKEIKNRWNKYKTIANDRFKTNSINQI